MDYSKIYFGILGLGIILLIVYFFSNSQRNTLLIVSLILIAFFLFEFILTKRNIIFSKIHKDQPQTPLTQILTQQNEAPKSINFVSRLGINSDVITKEQVETESNIKKNDYVTKTLAEEFNFDAGNKTEGGFFKKLFSFHKKIKPKEEFKEQLLTPRIPTPLTDEKQLELAWSSIKDISKTPKIQEKKVEPEIKEQVTTKNIENKEDNKEIHELPKSEQIDVLRKYVADSIKNNFPLDKIKEAALRANWPEDLIDEALRSLDDNKMRVRIYVLGGLIVLLFFMVIIFNNLGIFLLPYWIKSLKYASPQFYLGTIALLIAVTIIFILRIRKTVEKKKIEYKLVEEKNVVEIKQKLENLNTQFETDFDKLYELIIERGKLNFAEIAKAFNVSKEQAEEWGKILKEQDLITIHYPAFGEPELIWKEN